MEKKEEERGRKKKNCDLSPPEKEERRGTRMNCAFFGPAKTQISSREKPLNSPVEPGKREK